MCWCADVLKNDHTIPKQKHYTKTREAERIRPQKNNKKNKKLLQELLTNFLCYNIMFIVKREEEKTNEKENKKIIKKMLLYIITNILLFGSFTFLLLYGLSISPTIIK